MKIAVWNKKGGVGKTSLALSLAKDLGYYLISNDDSNIEMAYPAMSKIMNKPSLIDNCVYDFGGFVDANIIDIINKSDLVIIPFFSDLNSLTKTLSTANEINNKNIIFVENRAEKADDINFGDIEKYLKSEHPIFRIKNSRIWAKTFQDKKSVLDIKNENKISKYVYRNSVTEYENLLEYIIKKIGDK
jgi:hypothetical protein